MRCPYCEASVKLVNGRTIYPRRSDLAVKSFLACARFPECDAYVGCHPGTDRPLGRLADRELRLWKSKAHAIFDPLWKRAMASGRSKYQARTDAYIWLAGQLGISIEECHIGMFDVATCQLVVKICKPWVTA